MAAPKPNAIPMTPSQSLDLMTKEAAFTNFANFLESTKLADVTFLVGGQTFHGHKAILSAQSPVFAAMFEHDFQENRKNQVEIIDDSEEAFKELLRFVYSCKIENFDHVATELLVLSDKVSDGTVWIHDVLTFQPLLPQYQMDNLKSYCSRRISSTLDIDSAVEFLLLADLHQATYLKDKCIDFIVRRSDQVLATNGWQKLIKSGNSELLAELFSKQSRFSGRR